MAEEVRRTQLSDLVAERRAKLGLSYRDLALRCFDPESGEQVKHAWLERLEKREPVLTPPLAKLRALSAGTGIPLGILQDATAAQFLGMDTVRATTGTARTMIHGIENLSADDVARIQAIVDTFAAQGKRIGDA